MRAISTATAAILAGLLALAAAPAAAAPNLVVILADDLGYSDLGSYGGEIPTPNLDRLARQGVRFTQFYVTPRCSPTRASLLTGLYPQEVGVGHLNRDWGRPGYRGQLSADAVTLPEVLRAAGYRTYMAGKWHLAHNPELDGGQPGRDRPGRDRPDAEERRAWPRARGFDRFFGTIRGSGSYFAPAGLVRDDRFVAPGDGFYYTDAISSEAVRFLDEHAVEHPSRPFFLYLSYTAPHWPLHVPEDDLREAGSREAGPREAGPYDAGWDALRQARYRRLVEAGLLRDEWPLAPRDPRAPAWEDARHRAWQARRMEVYAAMVERMDAGIGRVLATLEAAGHLDDTLVLFLSDNGGNGEELRHVYRLGAFTMPLPGSLRGWRFGDNPWMRPGPADSFQTCGPGWSSLQNTPFRRGKHATYEGGIATPLLAHWPAGLGAPPGSLIHAPGHVVDLMPTLLEAAGAAYPARFAGRATRPLRGASLLPLLRGGTRRRVPMFFEHEGNRALRDGRWKLVSDWPWGWELYDLEADRTELHDLAELHPERVAAMAAAFDRLAREIGVEAWPWVSPLHRRLAWGGAIALALGVFVLNRRRRQRGRRRAAGSGRI